MDEIRIPNEATYAPVSLTDLMATAPLATRLLLGATLPGRVISAAALGLYAGSVARDWWSRQDMRWIDFKAEFGADVTWLDEQPEEERRRESGELAELLERDFTAERIPRKEVARRVNGHLTDTIAAVTGQRVLTSSEVRDFGLAEFLFPFAMGACDILSGDVAIFRDTGIFEPHVICHEFVHRKGYWKELHAQALSYMALNRSGDPTLVQAARAERLHRQLKVLAGDDHQVYHDLVEGLAMRDDLKKEFHALRPDPSAYESVVSGVMRTLYDQRLKVTGQNGISDYDRGFTNFLWTFGRSDLARVDRSWVTR